MGCFSTIVTCMIAILTLVQSAVRSYAERDGKTPKEQTSWYWHPKHWYGNHGHPSNFASAPVPAPNPIGSNGFYGEGHAQIHSYNVEMYPQNFNQMPPQPVLPQPAPQLILPQSAPSCQRPCYGAEQANFGSMAAVSSGHSYPPQMRVQMAQPHSQPMSMAPPPRPVAAPVQPDFGLGPVSTPHQDAIAHVEVTLVQSPRGFYHC